MVLLNSLLTERETQLFPLPTGQVLPGSADLGAGFESPPSSLRDS